MITRAGAVFTTFAFLISVAAALLFSATASAVVFSGSAKDQVGDGPTPGQDIASLNARYDNRQGKIDLDLRLRSNPGDSQLAVGLGRRAESGVCGIPLLVVGSILPSGQTIWLVERDGNLPAEAQGSASRSGSGARVKIQAKDSQLKGFRPNCAEVILSEAGNSAVVFDQMGPFKLKSPPAKPRLKVKLPRLGSIKQGGAKSVKVRVSNRGKAAAAKVVLRMRVKGAANLKPKVKRIGRIAAGKAKIIRFRVSVKPRGKGKVTLSARVSARKAKARASSSFRIKVPVRRTPKPSGALAGSIFWGFESYSYYGSQDPVLLHFTNGRFVRWGFPPKGLKPCRKVTAKLKKGEMQPGCLRYSFNRGSEKVRIGKVKGTYRAGRLKLKMDDDVWGTEGDTWYRGLKARGGTRFHTKLINRGYHGCGVNTFCTTWKENLTLTRGGKFGRQDSSLSTGGGIGTGLPFVGISKLGPDQRGRYKVLSGGRIRFNYANGRSMTETLIVQTDKRGRPAPVKEGLLVGDTWFYPE